MSGARARTMCVTGASGFLGSHCVKHALDNGFFVRATVRSAKKGEFLKKIPGAEDRLTIIDGCDLLVPGSFDSAIEGCDTVLHTASPFFWSNEEDKLVKPAVQGTENVLESCKKHNVKKVVLTSSTAAIYYVYCTKPKEHVFSEKDWTPEALVTEKKNFYCLSKTLAEKKAWEMSKNAPFKLASMNPCLIVGEMLEGQNHFNTSHSALLKLAKGNMIQQSCMHLVDVFDVARAHVHAAKMPLTWGGWGERFLLVGDSSMQEKVCQVMREAEGIPEEIRNNVPTKVSEEVPTPAAGAPGGATTLFDTSRSTTEPSEEFAKGLGLGTYISLKEMLESTFKTLVVNGFTELDKYTLDK